MHNHKTGYREIDVLTDASAVEYEDFETNYGYELDGIYYKYTYDGKKDNLDKIINILNERYLTSYNNLLNFKGALQKDYNNMMESILKYNGFYIGRFETYYDKSTKIVGSKYGKLPAQAHMYDEWYGLYAYQKAYSEKINLTSVTSSMISGNQWDATLNYILCGTNKALVNQSSNRVSSIQLAGYDNSNPSLNNIYDLAGNAFEFTLECGNASDTIGKVLRGGRLGQAASSRGFYNWHSWRK